MPADTAVDTSTTPIRPKPNKRRARQRLDRRFASGRRVKVLIGEFSARLGAAATSDTLVARAIAHAAELVALSEDASARALRADPSVSLDDVVRLSRASDLAVRRLQLDRHRAQPAAIDPLAYAREHVP